MSAPRKRHFPVTLILLALTYATARAGAWDATRVLIVPTAFMVARRLTIVQSGLRMRGTGRRRMFSGRF